MNMTEYTLRNLFVWNNTEWMLKCYKIIVHFIITHKSFKYSNMFVPSLSFISRSRNPRKFKLLTFYYSSRNKEVTAS
jgi:hypothetical protein